MSEGIRLQGKDPVVHPERKGISYSGGGPLVLIELGCASAFIEDGIVPDVIAGVSAGALAGTAHALDPVNGRGVELAVRLLRRIRARDLEFGFGPLAGRLARQGRNLVSLADHRALRAIVQDGIRDEFGIDVPTVGAVAAIAGVDLLVAATNRCDGTSLWYPPDTPIGDALLASSSIPGVFPWQDQVIAGTPYCLVDGGVITNQPLSRLVEAGCGTLFACSVGYGGGATARPTNALNNTLGSIAMMMHQTMKLEEDYVRLKIAGQGGSVLHVHPDVTVPIDGYDFMRMPIDQIIGEAKQRTLDLLRQQRPTAVPTSVVPA